MQMRMLLLVPAVVLLVSVVAAVTAAATTTTTTHPKLNLNLKLIAERAEKFSQSVNEALQKFFVEDLSDLTTGQNKCKGAFFCKVSDILNETADFGKTKEEEELLAHLDVYIKGKYGNCTELLRTVTPSKNRKPITEVVRYLHECIRFRNTYD